MDSLKDLEKSVKDNNGIHIQPLTRLLYLLRKKDFIYKKVFAEQAQNALSNYIVHYNPQNTEAVNDSQQIFTQSLYLSPLS